MMRVLLWPFLGFVAFPAIYLALLILSLGSKNPIEFPISEAATICAYLFAADLGWTLCGRSIPSGILGAVAGVILLGYGVPAMVNARVADSSDQAGAEDVVPQITQPPAVVALLTPYESTRDKWQVETDCNILCQRLLYWGRRKAVLMGATPSSGTPDDATSLVRYWIEPRSNCPDIKVPEASVMPGQSQQWGSYATSEAVESRIVLGDCLMSGPGSVAEADIVTMKSEPASRDFLRAGSMAGPMAVWRSDVFRRDADGWMKIGQSTTRKFSRAKVPLQLLSDGWVPRLLESREAGATPEDSYMIEHLLAPWLGWPEGLPGGSQGPPMTTSSEQTQISHS